ncbi:MAG: hypothetical protein E7B29_11415 [Mixta calida]|nr:hypothetical protein [Mixta calida]
MDPFTGTGTFMVRLQQSGIITPKDMVCKYASELHATELMLLAYYVAAVNIESTYNTLKLEEINETVSPIRTTYRLKGSPLPIRSKPRKMVIPWTLKCLGTATTEYGNKNKPPFMLSWVHVGWAY